MCNLDQLNESCGKGAAPPQEQAVRNAAACFLAIPGPGMRMMAWHHQCPRARMLGTDNVPKVACLSRVRSASAMSCYSHVGEWCDSGSCPRTRILGTDDVPKIACMSRVRPASAMSWYSHVGEWCNSEGCPEIHVSANRRGVGVSCTSHVAVLLPEHANHGKLPMRYIRMSVHHSEQSGTENLKFLMSQNSRVRRRKQM